LNRTYFVFFIVISLLLFSTKKSKAHSIVNSKYKIHSNFLKKPTQNSNTRILDFLINLDDRDYDETTSKSKHKTSKVTLTLNNKFNRFSNTILSASKFDIYYSSDNIRNNYSINSLFVKTTISIAICCLKI